MKRTPAQEQAVTLRGQDILVSAAAGSGKTRVLIDRIVQMIAEEGVPLEKMLVVTFTRAAAGELKDRLALGLEESLKRAKVSADQNQVSFLHKQLSYLPQANVSTLHAFCAKMLRSHFKAAGLEPNFRILQSVPASKLLNDALTTVFDQAYETDEADFADLVWAYGGANDDQPLRWMVEKLLQEARTRPQPSEWLAACGQGPTDDLPEALSQAFLDLVHMTAQQMTEALEAMARLLQDPMAEPLAPYLETLADDQVLVEAVDQVAMQAIEDAFDCLAPLKVGRLKSVRLKKDTDEGVRDLQEAFKDLRETGIKAPLKSLLDLLPPGGMDQVLADRQATLPRLQALGQLTKSVLDQYNELKTDKNSLDFNDLESHFLRLLEDETSLAAIRQEASYIFFDEYQDANRIQEAIIVRLAQPDRLFFVGDVKQAIYRFRQSDPGLFLRRYEAYDQSQGRETLIHLSENFRSQPRILRACNRIFMPLMTKHLGEVDYSAPGQALVPGQAGQPEDKPVELVYLNLDEAYEGESKYYKEGRWMAEKIKDLVRDEGKHYRDMAILMRTPRTHLADYERAFIDAEVPYYSDNSLVGFENMEVWLFLNMLEVINNDSYDGPLLAVLTSPFAGLTDEDLARIRLAEPKGRFSAAARAMAATGEGPIADRLRDFYDRLDRYRLRLKMVTIDHFALELLQGSGYGDFLKAMHQGEDRYANVAALIDLMAEYVRFSHSGLDGFLRHIEDIKKAPGDSLQPAVMLTEQDDCVRLMSIHKSKGLGFDTVFLADLYHTFNLRDTTDPLLVHQRLGCALNVVNLEAYTVRPSFEKKIIGQVIRQESVSEEVRLLYVAATRAINRLILLGREPKKEGGPLPGSALTFKLRTGRSFGDWLTFLARAGELEGEDLVIRHLTLQEEEEGDKSPLALAELPVNAAFLEDLKRTLSQPYPYLRASQEPYKKTVSQLAEENRLTDGVTKAWPPYFGPAGPTSDWRRPHFLDEAYHFTAQEQGTLLHRAVQLLANRVYTPATLQAALEDLVARQLMTKEEAGALDPDLLVRFYTSDTADRLRRYADTVEQEVSFTMFYQDHLIDGQIDLFYRDEAGYHIIDFKSDRVIQPERYRLQLDLYAQALWEARGIPVASKSLYWLRHGVASVLD